MRPRDSRSSLRSCASSLPTTSAPRVSRALPSTRSHTPSRRSVSLLLPQNQSLHPHPVRLQPCGARGPTVLRSARPRVVHAQPSSRAHDHGSSRVRHPHHHHHHHPSSLARCPSAGMWTQSRPHATPWQSALPFQSSEEVLFVAVFSFFSFFLCSSRLLPMLLTDHARDCRARVCAAVLPQQDHPAGPRRLQNKWSVGCRARRPRGPALVLLTAAFLPCLCCSAPSFSTSLFLTNDCPRGLSHRR